MDIFSDNNEYFIISVCSDSLCDIHQFHADPGPANHAD